MDYHRVPEGTILRDLGDGLIMRTAKQADTDALVAFNMAMHREADADSDPGIGAWVGDLMKGNHPTFAPADFIIVEDTNTAEIVSSVNLISQMWTYEGLPIKVGRPELVATHPDYRRRGLVRAQFEVLHAWSAERGEAVQAITGIPWYYRQFGYEMGLELGGGRSGYRAHVPRLPDGETDRFRVRPAREEDLPFVKETYDNACTRYLVSASRDAEVWRYFLTGQNVRSHAHDEMRIIETVDGEPVGFLAHRGFLYGPLLAVSLFELKTGASWFEVAPSVLRYLDTTGEEYGRRDGGPAFETLSFGFGSSHPVYEAIGERLPRIRPPYAWYVRVPNVIGFIKYVAPVLEQRLNASAFAGYSGVINVNQYRSGFSLTFTNGRLTDITPWSGSAEEGDAAFPDLTFLHLLFGHRSVDEIAAFLPDCWFKGEAPKTILGTIFPKKNSRAIPLG